MSALARVEVTFLLDVCTLSFLLASHLASPQGHFIPQCAFHAHRNASETATLARRAPVGLEGASFQEPGLPCAEPAVQLRRKPRSEVPRWEGSVGSPACREGNEDASRPLGPFNFQALSQSSVPVRVLPAVIWEAGTGPHPSSFPT